MLGICSDKRLSFFQQEAASMFRGVVLHALPIIALGLTLGCSGARQTPESKGEDQVRATFSALQAALKARDVDKLWMLLDAESQADAERAAQAIKAAYEKAGPDEKAQQEKALGLTGAELSSLSGRGFLKTNRFQGKYDEVPDSKLDKVTIQGDNATVAYTEADGDKEKVTLVRQEGRWKVTLPMPKSIQP
jgi:hypothetical protein